MLPERYTIENLRTALSNPRAIGKELTRVLGSWYFDARYPAPVDVMEEDWDYLLILDACRYDVFDEVTANDPRLSGGDPITSRASHSREFVEKTFSGCQHHDTVYVTANGYGAQVDADVFHDIIFTDHDDFSGEPGLVHPSWQGLAPSTVHDAALAAAERYPHKRHVVHFMQPHNPYFGERAEHLREDLEREGIVVTQRKDEVVEDVSHDDETVVKTLEHAAENGFVSRSQLREVYVENLEIVLDSVRSLLDELDGTVAITADHGEMLGEPVGISRNPKFGHEVNVYRKELRFVPWTVVESGPRPDITEAEPTATAVADDDAIDDRLAALGYKA